MRTLCHVCLLFVLALGSRPAIAQTDPRAVQPLRTAPVETLTVKPGVRDLGPAVLAGGTRYLGAQTGQAGLFAIDAATGKLRCTFRPATINGSVSTLPAIFGTLVITPYGPANPGAVIAVSAATGKEVWRAGDPSAYSAVVAEGERVFVVSKDCTLYALAAATGQEQWKMPLRFVPGGACTTSPVVRDGTVYAQIMARAPEGTAGWPNARYIASENALYALDRATGQPLFAPVFLRRVIGGRERMATLDGLIDGGSTLVGATEVSLIAFDKGSGRIVWELPGRFRPARLSLELRRRPAGGRRALGRCLCGTAEAAVTVVAVAPATASALPLH